MTSNKKSFLLMFLIFSATRIYYFPLSIYKELQFIFGFAIYPIGGLMMAVEDCNHVRTI
jgi:hypothetical protein